MTKAKRAGGVVQAVDHLPSKCEALSSNLRTQNTDSIFYSVLAKTDKYYQ
jgi:hypothetical protein